MGDSAGVLEHNHFSGNSLTPLVLHGWNLATGFQEVPSVAPKDLWFPLSRDVPDTYRYVVSEPLGRNSYKEQYLFLYR